MHGGQATSIDGGLDVRGRQERVWLCRYQEYRSRLGGRQKAALAYLPFSTCSAAPRPVKTAR